MFHARVSHFEILACIIHFKAIQKLKNVINIIKFSGIHVLCKYYDFLKITTERSLPFFRP